MRQGQLLKRESIHRGRVIDYALETVELPDGQRVELEIARHPGGAAAVALDARGRVCLLRQYRHAGGGWLWEIPAGRIDSGETPFATAARELAEEAGIQAGDWTDLGMLHSSPGIFTEVIHLWLGRDLTDLPLAHEPGELIEIHWIPFAQALDWCLDGTVTDAKTLIGLYRADALLRASPDAQVSVSRR